MLSNFSKSLIRRGYCIGASASARQTLAVQQRIQEKKVDALLGGGQRRIDNQHKKVSLNMDLI